ncbi:MAG: hypothetical protein V3U69_07085, partial [Bacteroidota bacterium]
SLIGRRVSVDAHQLTPPLAIDAVIKSNYSSVEAHFLSGFVMWQLANVEKDLRLLEKAVQYSRPVQSAVGFSAEGDTRPGDSPRISGRSKRQTVFWTSQERLSEIDHQALPLQMKVEYRKML